VLFTVEVPAPDEPVTTMIGCLVDIWVSLYARSRPRLPNRGARVPIADGSA
jgi:hypothetical protein